MIYLGKSYFTLAGLKPQDAYGNILHMEDPEYLDKRKGSIGITSYRVEHISWWKEELPSEAEVNRAKAL